MSAALQICLERENTLVQAFIEAVEAETRALADRKATDVLEHATREKEALAERLVALSLQRDELLAGLGLPAGHEGTEQAVRQFPELALAWEDLQKHAAIAREHNERNGMLIELSLRHTQETLDALRKLSSGQGSSMYDAQGRGRMMGYGKRNIVAT